MARKSARHARTMHACTRVFSSLLVSTASVRNLVSNCCLCMYGCMRQCQSVSVQSRISICTCVTYSCTNGLRAISCLLFPREACLYRSTGVPLLSWRPWTCTRSKRQAAVALAVCTDAATTWLRSHADPELATRPALTCLRRGPLS